MFLYCSEGAFCLVECFFGYLPVDLEITWVSGVSFACICHVEIQTNVCGFYYFSSGDFWTLLQAVRLLAIFVSEKSIARAYH